MVVVVKIEELYKKKEGKWNLSPLMIYEMTCLLDYSMHFFDLDVMIWFNTLISRWTNLYADKK